jgi:hypothetical protein
MKMRAIERATAGPVATKTRARLHAFLSRPSLKLRPGATLAPWHPKRLNAAKGALPARGATDQAQLCRRVCSRRRRALNDNRPKGAPLKAASSPYAAAGPLQQDRWGLVGRVHGDDVARHEMPAHRRAFAARRRVDRRLPAGLATLQAPGSPWGATRLRKMADRRDTCRLVVALEHVA